MYIQLLRMHFLSNSCLTLTDIIFLKGSALIYNYYDCIIIMIVIEIFICILLYIKYLHLSLKIGEICTIFKKQNGNIFYSTEPHINQIWCQLRAKILKLY